ncbi:MAG: class I SAM-dependent methyltransferase [Gemmatimonadota bacterium]
MAAPREGEPWQLRMFRKTLKKQQKVRLLLELLGPLAAERCLLITRGDNNGAMNWQFRAAGGRWTWAEFEDDAAREISSLLSEPVHRATADHLPFPDGAFERVLVIDVHEHLTEFGSFNREIARVVAPGGLAVLTTPNGHRRLPVAILKRSLGMGPEAYGHVVQGYTLTELETMVRDVGLVPEQRGVYSRFFTELVELCINMAYVKVLSRKKKGPRVPAGTIAPRSREQLEAVRKSYRAYSFLYPLVRVISSLDSLIPGRGGYAVAVAARKAS